MEKLGSGPRTKCTNCTDGFFEVQEVDTGHWYSEHCPSCGGSGLDRDLPIFTLDFELELEAITLGEYHGSR